MTERSQLPPPGSTSTDPAPKGLGDIIERLLGLFAQRDRVTVEDMLGLIGQRSFGPLLLVAGLISLSPLSGIFGVPTLMAAIIVLVAGQLLAGSTYVWLPRWLLQRALPARRAAPALRRLRRPAARIDRWIRPRLTLLTAGTGHRVIAGACILVALSMPPLELLPFAATTAGLLITLFALAIVAHDGLIALIALLLAGLIPGMVAVLAAQV